MEIYTQIKQKGTVTIPVKFRQKMGLSVSDMLRLKIEENRIILEPVRVLPYPTRRYSKEEVKEFLVLDKNET